MKRNMCRNLVCLVVALAVCMVAGACTKPASSPTSQAVAPATTTPKEPERKVYKWRMPSVQVQSHPGGQATLDFCKKVETMSGGQIVITPYLGNTLLPATEEFKAVSEGVVEMAHLYHGYNSGLEPEFDISCGMTGGMKKFEEEYGFWYNGGGLDFTRQRTESHNVYVIALDFTGPTGMISRVPINTVDDFKTKAIRVRSTAANTPFFKALGGTVVSVAAADAYTALQLGTFEATTYAAEASFVSLGWHEVAKYAYPTLVKNDGHDFVTINLALWKTLPDNLKGILTTAAVNLYVLQQLSVMKSQNIDAHNKMLQAGCKFPQFSAEDEAKLSQAALATWDVYLAKGGRTAQLLKMYGSYMKKCGYEVPAKFTGN